MIKSVTHAADGNTLTLSLNGKSQTYTNDKEGKRQAILDGLNAIETMAVGEDVYLPSNESLQVVAGVLYPDGIQTEAAYQTVCQVTEKACAHLGYGGEVELGPPAVPFARRGAYRRRYPPVDAQLVRDELALAGTSSSFPRQEIACTILWNKAGLAVYGRHWSKLTAAEQSLIQTQVDAIAAQDGWEKDGGSAPTATGSYTKSLPVDEATARSRLDDLLRRENGRPVLVSNVIYQAQLGAYGRGFYSNELSPVLQTIVSETLQAHGYRPTPQDGEYRPQPVMLAAAAETNLQEKLAALSPVMTEFGPALLLRDVVEALGVVSISEWQAEQLVADGRVGQALRQLGYQTELTWCQPYHFRPKRDDHEAKRVILKAVRVKNDPTRKLSLAQGLAVLTPALAIDDVDETLVYLEMVGAKQSVKANWAALVGGGKVHWLGRKRIRLDGMKEHVKIQATLPCGWANHILIHKQASLKEMNPEQPFYLLDDGAQPIPPLFYPMLNKCLALPLLPEWAGYLWENGRAHELITLLDEGAGQGYAAWRTLPSAEAWQAVIQEGLQTKQICF
ncbi:MAG: hypothetical protein BroJett014_24380 [Planctomycetota bacterium]|nr:MAG: hypothetical protein BroJett014_24380 [Planctomycetota bacterium]